MCQLLAYDWCTDNSTTDIGPIISRVVKLGKPYLGRSLLTEFYLQNWHKFEYLGTGATDSNDSSLIWEPLMSLRIKNLDFSDTKTGAVCIALWRCQFELKLAAPQDFFFNRGALNSGLGHSISLQWALKYFLNIISIRPCGGASLDDVNLRVYEITMTLMITTTARTNE